MFGKLFGTANKDKVNKKTEQVDTPQSRYVKQLIEITSKELGVLKTANYDFLNDPNLFLTLDESLGYESMDILKGIPIVHERDITYAIRYKQQLKMCDETLEDASNVWGTSRIRLKISSYNRDSPWAEFFVYLKENQLYLTISVQYDNDDNLLYITKFTEESNVYKRDFPCIDSWDLVSDYQEEIATQFIRGDSLKCSDPDVYLSKHHELLKQMRDDVIGLNQCLQGRCLKNNDFNLFFSTLNYDYNSIYSPVPAWQSFDWSTYDSFEQYKKYVDEVWVKPEKMSWEEFFYHASMCLVLAANTVMEVRETIKREYDEESGYLPKLKNKVAQGKRNVEDKILEHENGEAFAISSMMATVRMSPQDFLSYVPKADNNPDWDSVDLDHNSRVNVLNFLCYLMTKEATETMLSPFIKDSDKVKDDFAKNKNPSMFNYYGYLLAEVIIKYANNNDIYTSQIPYITYYRHWGNFNKKEAVAIKIYLYFVFALKELHDQLNINIEEVIMAVFSMVYHNGKTGRVNCDFNFDGKEFIHLISEFNQIIESGLSVRLLSPEVACDTIIRIAQSIVENNKFQFITDDLSAILDNDKGNKLVINEQDSNQKCGSRNPLHLGFTKNGKAFEYSGEGSITTIAPPRQGKSRCHVIPNLLTTPSSVFVIDPKGECFDATETIRMELSSNRVFKFAPFDNDLGDIFNPLEFLNPDNLWEDSKILASIIIPNTESKDENSDFFRDMAVDYLTAIFCYIISSKKEGEIPCISDIADHLLESELTNIESSLSDQRRPLRVIKRLIDQAPGTLQGVLATTQRALSCWEDDAIYNATSGVSTWTPQMLKKKGVSVFLSFPPAKIETYASVIRVISTLHINELIKEIPDRENTPDVVFFMDELPLLGYMKPVEDAVYVGAQYGVRAWLFAQSLGQLQKHYENAEGLIGSCDIRCFMNPSQTEGLAKKVSEDIGFSTELVSGEQRLRLEPSDVAGEKYSDNVFVFSNNFDPVIISKRDM